MITYVSNALMKTNKGENVSKKLKKPQPRRKTHIAQQITIKTQKGLDLLCKKSKLSRPMQLEALVENAVRVEGKHLQEWARFVNQ